MTVVFALIGMLVCFIPVRCAVNCIPGVWLKPGVTYCRYEGPVHRVDMSGKDLGLIAGGTVFYINNEEDDFNNDSDIISVYRIVDGKPKFDKIMVGDSAGKRESFWVGEKRRFFVFWKFKVDDHESEEINWSGLRVWSAFYQECNKKASEDASSYVAPLLKTIKTQTRPKDDFQGKFKKEHKGYWEIDDGDESVLTYVTPEEKKKIDKIYDEGRELYNKNFIKYLSPLHPSGGVKYSSNIQWTNVPIVIKGKFE
ncbi:MAG: hypothetical protein K5866_03845 [Treponema sp.]|nr:hypothetical protein [Treponema sp.]